MPFKRLPETPIAFVIPRHCHYCGIIGSVCLQHVVEGDRAMLHWHCDGCHAKWPVMLKQQDMPKAR